MKTLIGRPDRINNLDNAELALKHQFEKSDKIKAMITQEMEIKFNNLHKTVEEKLEKLKAWNEFANSITKVMRVHNKRISVLEEEKDTIKKIKVIVSIIVGLSAIIAVGNGIFMLSSWLGKLMH